ncbi:uncharacterized protein LOC110401249 [Numida meleagris]|uniref:uncharacterized protein LOC110401249 n=1 Tax=Numida meleagris TaxID=8996 RepID=UPI000B3DC8E8|nr:uncharacterized protein LOC110401249 [Numida meleagris]
MMEGAPAAARHSGTGETGRRQCSHRERPPATATSRHCKVGLRKRSRFHTAHTQRRQRLPRDPSTLPPLADATGARPRLTATATYLSAWERPALSRYHAAACGAAQSEPSATPGRGSGLANHCAPGGGICPHGNDSPGRWNATGLPHRDAQVLGGTPGSCSLSSPPRRVSTWEAAAPLTPPGRKVASPARWRAWGGREARSGGRAAGQLLSREPLAAARGRAGGGALLGGRLTAATPVRFKITVARRSSPLRRGFCGASGAEAAALGPQPHAGLGGQPSPPAAGGDGPQEVTRQQPRGWVCGRLSSKQQEELRRTWQRHGLMGGHCATTGKPRLLCPGDRAVSLEMLVDVTRAIVPPGELTSPRLYGTAEADCLF